MFPLPDGCRSVCRPKRTYVRHFTPRALTRIVKNLVENGIDKMEVCDAVKKGGVDCVCSVVNEVVAEIDLLLADSSHQRIQDALRDIETMRDWLDNVDDWIEMVNDWIDRLPNIPGLRQILARFLDIVVTAWRITRGQALVVLSGIERLIELWDDIDPTTVGLRKIRQKLLTFCEK